MNKIINRYQAIYGTVWIIICCVIISLWPLRLVTERVISGSNQQMSMQSEAITSDYVVEQMFVAQYDHLQKIRVYLLNESAGEQFNFVLRDASRQVLMQQVISTDEMEEMPGFCTIQVNQDTQVGSAYYYQLQGISSDFYVAYEDTASSGTIYNGTLYYGNVEDTEHNIITEYEYKIPLRKGKTLVCDILLILTGIAVSFLAGKYYKRYPERNRLLTVETVWKRVAGPVVIVAALVGIIAIYPCKLFSEYAENNLFLIAGVCLIAGILLYGIYHTRLHKSHDMGLAVLQDKWADYLQTACYALAIQAGVHYLNGLYELHHTIAYREMLIWLGLAIVTTYKRKEIFHLINLVYLVAAAVIGYYYYQSQLALLPDATDEEIQAIRLTVYAGVIAGIVIINTVSILVRRCFSKITKRNFSFLYMAVMALFFILILVYRNTRGWPIYLVCAYSLYYLRMAVWEKKERLLPNLCNGILLHFLAMTGYCLLHRPYMFYEYYRYPFVFHTVTISAVYLSLVVCAALVKLLDAYRREQKLSFIWKELTVFGMASVYLIFTLSRTGYLAILVTALIIIPSVTLGMRKKIKSLLVITAMMFASVVLCFPAVFSAQRIVPAIVAEPETMEIEKLPDEIMHGRDLDSNYYMTIRRFLHVFELKVLGIPEEECINQYKTAKDDRVGSDGYALVDRMLVASADLSGGEIPDGSEPEEAYSDAEKYTNGRLDIFRLYWENRNMEGHDEMGITLPDGSLIVHAHNIYLQTMYDFGIPIGIVFILFGLCTLIYAAVYYKKRKDDRRCSILPLALLLLFAVAGITEWIFHPCYPITFCLLLSLAPLLTDVRFGEKYADVRRENGHKHEKEKKTV